MNTIFDINRLGLLLKRFFLENKQRELTFWGLATLVFILMHLSGSKDDTSTEFILIFIAGFIFAAKMFKIFNYTPGGMHYLLIPATHLEKLITAILLSTVYFIAMILITHVIGTTLGTTFGNMYWGTNNPIFFELIQSPADHTVYLKLGMSLSNKIILFAAFQSVFMLGSIYFRRNAVGKTILAIIVVLMLLIYISALLKNTIFGIHTIGSQSHFINLASSEDSFKVEETIFTIIKYAFIPFLWIVSYFRLTEKQV